MFTLKETQRRIDGTRKEATFFELWDESANKGLGKGAFDKDSARFILSNHIRQADTNNIEALRAEFKARNAEVIAQVAAEMKLEKEGN